MSYRSFKKDMDKKREEQNVMNALNGAISALEKKRNEYAEKAKAELKKGNTSQYSAYVALLKNAMFNLAQSRDMLTNYTIARDLREMQSLNQRFVKSINSVMKDVYKTSKSIKVASSQKLFNKALYKQNYTAVELQQLLKDNHVAFASSVSAISDISDDEIRSVLESEIKRDDGDLDEMLNKLEKEFSAEKKPLMMTEDVHKASVGHSSAVSAPEPEESEKDVPRPVNSVSENGNGGRDDGKLLHTGKLDVAGAAFRPQRLKDYIGQPNAVATLSDPIKKALLTDKPLPHVLLCGSYGQGKTTLAKIIANEMGSNFININPAVKARDLQRILKNLKKGDIVFIDEVHMVSRDIVESILYPAMEDFELHSVESTSIRTNTKTQKIAPFTLIGATTETGKLLKPFYSKFPINVSLCDYELKTIAAIIKNSFGVNSISISDELCFNVAKRSRLSPRTANAYVEGIASLAIVREAERRNIKGKGALSSIADLKIEISADEVANFFSQLDIDENGLKPEERKILQTIIEKYDGGPVGQENIAKALNVATNRVDQEYEPYLVKLGLINIRPQGRYATDAAYGYLGIAKPKKENALTENGDSADGGDDGDGLPVIECEIGAFDGKSAERFAALFSGEAQTTEKGLDELFPDVNKEYDSAAANRYVLKVGGRELYCDSKLERRLLCYLFKKGFITDAKSEALELEYSSGRMSGKKYFPDFVLKLHDGTVAVVEMKNLSAMGYHLNADKYEALANFCRKNGYAYAEIAKDCEANRYVSAEQIKERAVNTELKDFIYGKISQNGICSSADFAEVKYDVYDLINLLLNDRGLKNIDRTGSAPQIVSAED